MFGDLDASSGFVNIVLYSIRIIKLELYILLIFGTNCQSWFLGLSW